MGEYDSQQRYMNEEEVTLFPSQQISASADGEWIEIGDAHTLRLTLDVTQDDFTTLDVDIECSDDKTNIWTAGSFAQAAGVGSEVKGFSGLGRYVRVEATFSGTTGTFSVSGKKIGE